MNDCISRKGVSAWLDNLGYHRLANMIMDKNRFPSTDRPRGEWIHEIVESINSTIGYFSLPSCQCSECGIFVEYESKFCPNCGTRMKGMDDE